MRPFLSSRARSFGYAFSGWWFVIHTQKNAWIHAIISILVIAASIWVQISPHEWAIIIIAIAMVWTAEFLNTALEAVVDLASPHQHPMAKVGKDVGAAAVLIAAASAALIGVLILGPPIYTRLHGLFPQFRF